MTTFQRRLQEAIDRFPYPLKIIAHRSGYSVKYIQELKHGHKTNPTILCVEALASALQLSPMYLAGWSPEKENHQLSNTPTLV